MKVSNFSRRDFIKTGAFAAGALLLNPSLNLFSNQDKKSTVVLIRNLNAVNSSGIVNGEIIQQMLDEAVTTLFNEKDIKSAWQKIIKPEDIVGIKSNGWRYLRTPRELENAIKKRVMDSGVNEEKISINDQGVLRDPVFNKATALINTRPMRTHYWSGVGSLIKNYIMFNEVPSSFHDDSCADMAKIWFQPNVKGKTRLNVLVMLTPLFHSVGPHGFSSEYVWNYGGLIVGVDPVACDSVGLRIIEAKRKEFFKEERPLNPPAKHIALSDTRHHLGNSDPKKINLIKLGVKQDILI